jgi:LysR family transcriptional regulator, glycine cleavage system transcriptional activator
VLALRTGGGRWKGLQAEQLADSPLIVVGSAQSAERLGPSPSVDAIANEPLLGEPEYWERWFRQAGSRMRCKPVADFNDFGLMLQATEQDLGIALGRELLAADALQSGRLVRLSPWTLNDVAYSTYWFAYLDELAESPPILALRDWLREEMALSRAALAAHQPAV